MSFWFTSDRGLVKSKTTRHCLILDIKLWSSWFGGVAKGTINSARHISRGYKHRNGGSLSNFSLGPPESRNRDDEDRDFCCNKMNIIS